MATLAATHCRTEHMEIMIIGFSCNTNGHTCASPLKRRAYISSLKEKHMYDF